MKIKRALSITIFLTLTVCLLYSFQTHQITKHSNSELTLHANQIDNDLSQQYLNAITRAEKSILLLVFSLKDKKIIEVLNQQSKNGIQVKIVTDAKASPNLKEKLDSNIQLTQRFFKGLMHLKILVTDENEVWIGSANMTTDSLKRHGNLVLSVNHPGLASTIARKASQLGQEERLGTVPESNFTIQNQNISLLFFPDSPDGAQQIKQLIRSAQKTIRVAMYTWTRMDFAYELLAAQQRGVDVQVAIDKGSSLGVSKKVTQFLNKNHVPVEHNSGKSLLHHKFLYIDGETLVLGSANWTKAAFKTNDDCYVILHPLTPVQTATLDKLWNVIALY